MNSSPLSKMSARRPFIIVSKRRGCSQHQLSFTDRVVSAKSTFGQGGVDFGDFASWAARMMCEPVDDGFGSNDDQKQSPSLSSASSEEADEEGDMDAGGWRRGKSRQYGGGTSGAGAAEEHPPPISSVRLTPADKPNERDTASTSWEYRRDESTGIMVRMFALLRIEITSSHGWLAAHPN